MACTLRGSAWPGNYRYLRRSRSDIFAKARDKACCLDAQARHTQTNPRASSGTLSSTCGGTVSMKHQQFPFPAAIPQSLGLPQRGQLAGSTRVLFMTVPWSIARA